MRDDGAIIIQKSRYDRREVIEACLLAACRSGLIPEGSDANAEVMADPPAGGDIGVAVHVILLDGTLSERRAAIELTITDGMTLDQVVILFINKLKDLREMAKAGG